MSNFLSIATVTASLRRTLQETVPNSVPAADATAVRPDLNAVGLPETGVNVYLFQVTPNAAWRNEDLPTRTSSGNVVQKPRIALDLHYLLTFYGDEALLEPQRVMGGVVQTFHARPYLTRDVIENTVSDPAFSYLVDSDLAEEVELVKFTPIPFNLEELSKLWSVLFQTTYSLSMVYMGTVVLIEGEDIPQRALPVAVRNISITPFQRATIESVINQSGESAPIVMGDTLLIRGEQLDGFVEFIRVGVAILQPVTDSVTPTQMSVELNNIDLRSGVQGIQVVYSNGHESNIAAIVLRPDITINAPGVSSSEIPITFNPPVGRDQKVDLFLNEIDPPGHRTPYAYSFSAPADNGISNPAVNETTDVTFSIQDVETGDYVVRVKIAGAENVLTTGLVGGVVQYNAPQVSIP